MCFGCKLLNSKDLEALQEMKLTATVPQLSSSPHLSASDNSPFHNNKSFSTARVLELHTTCHFSIALGIISKMYEPFCPIRKKRFFMSATRLWKTQLIDFQSERNFGNGHEQWRADVKIPSSISSHSLGKSCSC